MSSFASLLGKRVEVNYRAADIHMCITATLARDSGRCIQLEERFSQSGRQNTLRIEIPYSALISIREVALQPQAAAS